MDDESAEPAGALADDERVDDEDETAAENDGPGTAPSRGRASEPYQPSYVWRDAGRQTIEAARNIIGYAKGEKVSLSVPALWVKRRDGVYKSAQQVVHDLYDDPDSSKRGLGIACAFACFTVGPGKPVQRSGGGWAYRPEAHMDLAPWLKKVPRIQAAANAFMLMVEMEAASVHSAQLFDEVRASFKPHRCKSCLLLNALPLHARRTPKSICCRH